MRYLPTPLFAGLPSDLKMDTDNKGERKMTEGEIMKGFDYITKRYATPISTRYTAAQLDAHVGKMQDSFS